MKKETAYNTYDTDAHQFVRMFIICKVISDFPGGRMGNGEGLYCELETANP